MGFFDRSVQNKCLNVMFLGLSHKFIPTVNLISEIWGIHGAEDVDSGSVGCDTVATVCGNVVVTCKKTRLNVPEHDVI
jgi:hypothetical protein